MFKPKTLARFYLKLGGCFLLPALLSAQTEKSGALQTPLLEKIELDATHAAQYVEYRIRGFELGVVTLRDAFVSPLLLEGTGFKISSEQLRFTPQALKHFNFGTFTGLTINQTGDFNLMLLNFSGQYSWQFPLWEKSGWKFYAGPWAQGFGNLRFALQNVNNVLGYDAGLDLGPTGRAEFKFKPARKEFMLTQQLSVPLVSAFVRPLYTFTGPIIGDTDSEVSIFQVGTLNRRFGWVYKASLDLYRTRKHKRKPVTKIPYRISYTFQYDQFSKPNPAQSVLQSITLSKILKY